MRLTRIEYLTLSFAWVVYVPMLWLYCLGMI